MTEQSYAIQSQRLSKSFGGRMVLREIDLQISSGECVALSGDNGAGKTTFLRCLAAIARPTAGKVYWFGKPAAASPEQRGLVGMVTHESRLYAHLTMRENLLFAARMCGVTSPGNRADTLLERIGLRASANRRAGQISRGMRQRLALARTLIHEPSILLLDEPFSGLDSTSRDWLVELLHEQQACGRAVCFATHDQEQIRQLANRRLDLQDGSLARQMVMADVSSNDNSRRYSA